MLWGDDVEQLRAIADRVRTAYAAIGQSTHADRDADYLRDLADRVLRDLAEPPEYPWPGPADEPKEDS